MTTINNAGLSVTEPAAVPNLTLELRLPVEVTEAPLSYDDHDGILAVEVMLAGGGYANLILPVDGARAWAGELFAAVTVAHREATGDPHALTDLELAELGDPDGYDPGPGILVQADQDQPARVLFHILLDIRGDCLSTADLRAALVEHLSGRFNVARLAVSAGEPLAGRVS
jgi:hypothetical protein